MQITETSANGLSREYQVVISAQDIAAQVDTRLEELRHKVQIPGFRPGKVPVAVIRQRYGDGVRQEVLEQAVENASRQTIKDHALRVAMQPKVSLESYAEGQDLVIKLAAEVIPDIEPGTFSDIELERLVAEVEESAVDAALGRLAETHTRNEPLDEPRPAVTGDVAVLDFDGSVGGERKPGMKGDGVELELGSGRFIPGFEEQLVGMSPGEHRSINVSFPADYPAQELAGADAVFEVDLKELRRRVPAAVDDELAKGFGLEGLDKLKEAVRDRLKRDYAEMSRMRVKRQLLDRLAEGHSFPVPQGMVDVEFESIWNDLQEEIKRSGAPDTTKSEDEMRGEYRGIAERRVRLGLLLAEIGRRNNIEVSQDELNRALVAEARRYPGQERVVYEYYRKNIQAVDNLRAPIFENKVVDFILELAKVNERTVPVAELMADPEEGAAAA
jgi:trigger factor